jgi:hypothetical protein
MFRMMRMPLNFANTTSMTFYVLQSACKEDPNHQNTFARDGVKLTLIACHWKIAFPFETRRYRLRLCAAALKSARVCPSLCFKVDVHIKLPLPLFSPRSGLCTFKGKSATRKCNGAETMSPAQLLCRVVLDKKCHTDWYSEREHEAQ